MNIAEHRNIRNYENLTSLWTYSAEASLGTCSQEPDIETDQAQGVQARE